MVITHRKLLVVLRIPAGEYNSWYMLRIAPIPEHEATGEIRELYESIKMTVGADSVPLVFQYLASFPDYFRFLWEQTYPNLTDPAFQSQIQEIARFGQTAIAAVYSPSPMMELLLERISNRPEQQRLEQVAYSLLGTNASLYLLSLAIRESLKGKYLGIKQIGSTLSEEEKRTFYTVTDSVVPPPSPATEIHSSLQSSSVQLVTRSASTGLTASLYQEFFRTVEREMEILTKRESYLSRRVELERFALAKLPLLPYPLDSSFVSMTRKSGDHPQFPELVYLLAEVFPTQTPYKLLASTVMQQSLKNLDANFQNKPVHVPADPTENTNTRSTAVSLENVND